MESTLDVEKVIREYIAGIIHLSLSTCNNNMPWVCEVHYAYDDELNLYFRSKTSTRHCREIASNAYVAGNIVEPHGLNDKPRGVYFEGTAELLSNVTANDPAFTTYNDRFGDRSDMLEDAANPDGHQFYKINVNNYYVFDARESKPSQKYHLKWKD
jgi:uncharacterized protein YhbP (UPF0306 family)